MMTNIAMGSKTTEKVIYYTFPNRWQLLQELSIPENGFVQIEF